MRLADSDLWIGTAGLLASVHKRDYTCQIRLVRQQLQIVEQSDMIFERISQIHREDGVTILLVEQRVAEALERSDHGYVLETGHIVLEGPYQTLLADDRVRRSYLGLTEA